MDLELDDVKLREIVLGKDELTGYLSWLRDTENNSFISSVRDDYEMSELLTYIAQKNESSESLLLGIFHGESQKLVGTVKLEPIDVANQTTWLGIMIGEPRARGIGIGYKSLVLVTSYAINHLGIKTIFLGVDPRNTPAIKLYEKVGFIRSDEYKNAMCYSL